MVQFSLYYFGLLIVLAEDAERLDAWTQRDVARWRKLEYALPTVACAVVCALLADNLRVRDAVPETTALTHESIRRALAAATTSKTSTAMLEFPDVDWPVAAAVGLELARGGTSPLRWRTAGSTEFGRDHAKKPFGAKSGQLDRALAVQNGTSDGAVAQRCARNPGSCHRGTARGFIERQRD